MQWVHYISYFFGGTFFVNAIPHLVSGLMGMPFQGPTGKPMGRGPSSSTVNVLWGFLNLFAGYWLVCQVGSFNLRSKDALALGFGILAMGLVLSRFFGRLHGGNSPKNSVS